MTQVRKLSHTDCPRRSANALLATWTADQRLSQVQHTRSCSCEPEWLLTLWQRGEDAVTGKQSARPQCAAGWDGGPTPRAPLLPSPWRLGSTARCHWGFEAAARSEPSTLHWPGPGRPAARPRGSWSLSWSANPRLESIPPLVPSYTLGQASMGLIGW